jgi:hypothetical protein
LVVGIEEWVFCGEGCKSWREVHDLIVRFNVQRTHFEGLRLISVEDETHINWGCQNSVLTLHCRK